MHWFALESAAHDAGIPPDGLRQLSEMMRKEFPTDDMMCELHVLRACLAIGEGQVTLQEALREPCVQR